METKSAVVAWKSSDDPNIMTGYASTFGGPPDSYGDIIDKGAYSKTIKERIKTGKVCLCDGHKYDADHVVGLISDGVEDDIGLLISARMSKAEGVKDTITKMKEGILTGLSIGFDTVQEVLEKVDGLWIRHLKEIRLREISLTPIPACDTGRVVSVKTSTVFDNLELAPPNTFWDPVQAFERVKDWASADRGPNIKFKKAFLGIDMGNPTEFSSCVHQFADIVDGNLKAVPRAICKLAFVIKSDEEAMRGHLEKYLFKMGFTPPWKSKSIDTVLWEARAGIIDSIEINRAIQELKAAEAGPVRPPTSEAGKSIERLTQRKTSLGEHLKC